MVAQAQVGSTFSTHLLHFVATNIGNADGTLTAVQTDNEAYVMPHRGSILGVGAALNGTLITGTLTLLPTINGTPAAAFPDAASMRTNQQYGVYNQDGRKNGYQFNAGDRIGLIWNKAGTVNPTTRDAAVLLTVLFEEVRY